MASSIIINANQLKIIVDDVVKFDTNNKYMVRSDIDKMNLRYTTEYVYGQTGFKKGELFLAKSALDFTDDFSIGVK